MGLGGALRVWVSQKGVALVLSQPAGVRTLLIHYDKCRISGSWEWFAGRSCAEVCTAFEFPESSPILHGVCLDASSGEGGLQAEPVPSE